MEQEDDDDYVPMTPADYDRLAQILASFPSTDAMTLEELDGYFCALACSPDVVPSEESMPLLWGSVGDDDELFPDVEAAAHFFGMINRHYQGLVLRLEAEEEFEPMLLPDESGKVTGSAWAWGFVLGMRFHPEAWNELVDDEEQNVALAPILLLAQERDPDPDPELPPLEPIAPEEREILVQALSAAAPAVYDYFWEARQGDWEPDEEDGAAEDGGPLYELQTPYRRETPKVGRNDPCPCGSGKKYKRCCGQDA
jgi:uncharacterized protein